MPSLALWRGERSDDIIKSYMFFSDICQIRRLGLVLNRRAFYQWSRDVDRLDVLFVPTPLYRQSQWALYPHIALDFAVVSAFKIGLVFFVGRSILIFSLRRGSHHISVGEFQVAAEKAQGIVSSYAEIKRSHHAIQE